MDEERRKQMKKENLQTYKKVSKKIEEVLKQTNSAGEELELQKIEILPKGWDAEGVCRVEVIPKYEYSR